MAKKVTFTPKPPPVPSQDATASLDAWVSGSSARRGQGERTKRLTIDVDEGLHRRIKAACANRGVQMADEVRRILEREFPEKRVREESERTE